MGFIYNWEVSQKLEAGPLISFILIFLRQQMKLVQFISLGGSTKLP